MVRDEQNEVYVKSPRWSEHYLRQVLGFGSLLDHRGPIFHHCAREFNVAADAVANKVLDCMEDITVLEYIDPQIIRERFMGLALWTDGASRGNPGESSAAACMCAVLRLNEGEEAPSQCTGHALGHFVMHGVRVCFRIVACIGRYLGCSTNNHAEFEAACIGGRTAVDWLRHSRIIVTT